jgi:hypothetical protein
VKKGSRTLISGAKRLVSEVDRELLGEEMKENVSKYFNQNMEPWKLLTPLSHGIRAGITRCRKRHHDF